MKFNIICQYHPAAALHQPRLWSTMLTDWETLPQKADCSYTVTDKMPKPHQIIALDTENAPDGGLGCWSVAYREDDKVMIVPFYGQQHIEFDTLVAMHNARWDLRVLRKAGMKPPKKVACTMIAAYCMGLGKQDVRAEERYDTAGMVGGLGLKYLARRHLGFQMQTWEEVKDHPESQQEYNAKDSVATLLLWEKWVDKLPQHFWTIDMPLMFVLMFVEDKGIKIDRTMVQEYEKQLAHDIEQISLPFNPFSVPQLQSYIYGTLGIEPFRFTDSGAPSVDEEVLETIDDPVIKKVLEYKHLFKEKDTYIENYINRVGVDGRIHPEFKQCSTATGRLSSANPNLQNVPKTEMRKLFIAEEGKKIIRVDFSQIELRVFAVLAQEPEMLRAFAEGRNIHEETCKALGWNPTDPSPSTKGKTRYDDAKTINFLMLYGGGAWKISQEFHIPIDEAAACIKRYMAKYQGIQRYFEETIARVNVERKVASYFGRTRRMDALYAEDWRVKKQGEREAINTPIQGTAAEIVKLAMIDLREKHAAPMILQVHDELLFESDAKTALEYGRWLKEYIPTITTIGDMRFEVEVGVGDNWFESAAKGNCL